MTIDAIRPPAKSLPVQPSQPLSTIDALLLCLLLLAYDPFRRRDGELFAIMLTIYPITRFLIEGLRSDEAAVFGTGLSIAQCVSLLLLLRRRVMVLSPSPTERDGVQCSEERRNGCLAGKLRKSVCLAAPRREGHRVDAAAKHSISHDDSDVQSMFISPSPQPPRRVLFQMHVVDLQPVKIRARRRRGIAA